MMSITNLLGKKVIPHCWSLLIVTLIVLNSCILKSYKMDLVGGIIFTMWVCFVCVFIGASIAEKIATFLLLPLLRFAIYKSMGCGKENAKEISFRKITEIFLKVKTLSFHSIFSQTVGVLTLYSIPFRV